MRKIIVLVFFTITILNVWASDQSLIRVSEPIDALFKVTAGKPISKDRDSEVSYSNRRDFIDFYTVENARLNCVTGQKQVLSSDEYSTATGNQTNHVDFTKSEHQLTYILVPSQKEFKEACKA